VVGSLLAVLGMQMLSFGLSARAYAFSEQLVGRDRLLSAFFRVFSLERGLLLGAALTGVGLVTWVYILRQWLAGDVRFDQLIHLHEAIAASTLMMMGVQISVSAFFLSLLALHKQHHVHWGD
jgi:hypothetical protein